MRAFVELLHLLTAVESIEAGAASIRLREADHPVGEILAVAGRIGYAVSDRRAARLLPLLAQEAGLSLDELRRRLPGLRAGSGSLGERLLDGTGIDPAALQRAFLRHTAYTVSDLAGRLAHDGVRIEAPQRLHQGPGASPLSVTTGDVLREIVADSREFSFGLPAPPPLFLDLEADLELALCFLLPEDPSRPGSQEALGVPLALRGSPAPGAGDLQGIFRAARRFEAACRRTGPGLQPIGGVMRLGDHGWAVIAEGPFLLVLRLADPSEAGRVLFALRGGAA